MTEKASFSPLLGDNGLPPVEVSVTCDLLPHQVTTISVSDGDNSVSLRSNVPLAVRVLHVNHTGDTESLDSEESSATQNQDIAGNHDDHVITETTSLEDSSGSSDSNEFGDITIGESASDVVTEGNTTGIEACVCFSTSGDIIRATPEECVEEFSDHPYVVNNDTIATSSSSGKLPFDDDIGVSIRKMSPTLNNSDRSLTKVDGKVSKRLDSTVRGNEAHTHTPDSISSRHSKETDMEGESFKPVVAYGQMSPTLNNSDRSLTKAGVKVSERLDSTVRGNEAHTPTPDLISSRHSKETDMEGEILNPVVTYGKISPTLNSDRSLIKTGVKVSERLDSTVINSEARSPTPDSMSSLHSKETDIEGEILNPVIAYGKVSPTLNNHDQSMTKAGVKVSERLDSIVMASDARTLTPTSMCIMHSEETDVQGEFFNLDGKRQMSPSIVTSQTDGSTSDGSEANVAPVDILGGSVSDNSDVNVAEEDLPFDMGQNNSIIIDDESLTKSSRNSFDFQQADDTDDAGTSRSGSLNTDSTSKLPEDMEYSPSEFGNPSSILNLIVAPFGSYAPADPDLLEEESDTSSLLPHARSKATTYFKNRGPKLPPYPNRSKAHSLRGRHGLPITKFGSSRKLAIALDIRKKNSVLRETLELAEIARSIHRRRRVSEANREWKTYENDVVKERVSDRVRFAQTARLRVVLEEKISLINRIVECLLNSPCLGWKTSRTNQDPPCMEEYEFSMA